jgi:hypothetical protein
MTALVARRPRVPAPVLAGVLSVVGVALFAYRGELRRAFVLDDWTYLAGSLGHYVGHPTANVYRPVLAVWFVLGRNIFGLHPTAFHLAAFALLLANAAMLAVLARRLGLGFGAAWLAAVVYAAHPALSGAVGWVSAVNALLVATFALPALLTLTLPRPPPWAVAVAAVATLLAIASREDALVLVAVAPAVRWVLPALRGTSWRERVRPALLPCWPVWGVTVAYMGMRLLLGASTKGTAYETGLGRLSSNAVRMLEYAMAVPMLPAPGQLTWHRWEAVGVGGGLLLALLSLLVVRLEPVAVVGVLWAAAGIVPSLLLVRHAMEPYYLDLALPGLALAAGALGGLVLRPLGRLSPAVPVVCGVVLGLALAGLGRVANTRADDRSALTRFRARQAQLLMLLPRQVPRAAVLCFVNGRKNPDVGIAQGGALYRVALDDDRLGLVVVPDDPGSPVIRSVPAGATGPVLVVRDPGHRPPRADAAGQCVPNPSPGRG